MVCIQGSSTNKLIPIRLYFKILETFVQLESRIMSYILAIQLFVSLLILCVEIFRKIISTKIIYCSSTFCIIITFTRICVDVHLKVVCG
jgi:hypothetical protein